MIRSQAPLNALRAFEASARHLSFTLAGLELDFLRHWVRFRPDTTSVRQRRQITTDFVRRVRTVLDQTAIGGTVPTLPGYGPNTRTVMQFRVANTAPAPAYNLAALQNEFASTATTQGVFARSEDPIIVPQAAYNSAYPSCNILNGDINHDGAVNPFDIDPFILCLTAGCP